MGANPNHRVPDHAASAEVTVLLAQLVDGDQQVASRLVPLVYSELRQMAARYMKRERVDHTLQTTALVHEAYLKLVEQTSASWQNRAHFFAIAAQIMRHILIDHARAQLREKRGGGQSVIQLDEGLVFSPEQSSELLEVDTALHRLAELDPRQSKIVELRFFGGLTVEETAAVLGISPKTVKRDWSVAKAWLHGELKQGHGNIAGKMGDR
jgi:RNA polymerase sigma factor (TIGR02999 family)